MKQVLFLIAILFAVVGYSQNKPVGGSKWVVFKPAYKKDGISPNDSGHLLLANNIAKKIFNKCTDKNHWVIKESKSLASPEPGKIRFERRDNGNAKRNGDTLTIIDKSIKFIVVDGVTYEIVRNTEVKKVETHVQEWPLNLHYIPFQRDTSYKGLRIGFNGITLTPAVFY